MALALTQALGGRQRVAATVMMLGYGVGLSWGAALARIDADAMLMHSAYTGLPQRS